MKRFFLIFTFLSSLHLFAEQEGKTIESPILKQTSIKPLLEYQSVFSTVIELDDFSRENNTTSEILSFSPGAVARDFGGFGQLITLSNLGSSNDQVFIFLEGVIIRSPLGGGGDLSTIPLHNVEKLEIIRGGASALVGSDSIGGAVNIVTKIADKPFTNSFVTYGSFNTLNLNLSRAQKFGNLSHFFSFTHRQSDGDFKFEFKRVWCF
jgi:vitamin B12 transporter